MKIIIEYNPENIDILESYELICKIKEAFGKTANISFEKKDKPVSEKTCTSLHRV